MSTPAMTQQEPNPLTAGGKGPKSKWRSLFLVAALLASTTAMTIATTADAYAAGTYQTTTAVNVRASAGTGGAFITTKPAGAGFTLLCQVQGSTNIGGNLTWDDVRFADGVTGFITDFNTTTPSFNSYAPGTGACTTNQMQAAVNWAIAEKNSPDPTWSDHFGHAWSGYCEQFVEQAEGFQFRFASALANYNWELANGRIHTDTNPPAGALVFYGGGGGFGHVAVSIGNGQEIGTLGFVGQRLRVSQYPVVGFLSNPYLGWANPIGS